jgi:hypothetical protein
MCLEISKIPSTNVAEKVNLLEQIRDSANATLENHYGNDLDQFANKWKKVALIQF